MAWQQVNGSWVLVPDAPSTPAPTSQSWSLPPPPRPTFGQLATEAMAPRDPLLSNDYWQQQRNTMTPQNQQVADFLMGQQGVPQPVSQPDLSPPRDIMGDPNVTRGMIGTNIGHGATFGLLDEASGLVGGVGSVLSGQPFSEGWDRNRNEVLNDVNYMQNYHPDEAAGMEIGGGILTGVGLGSSGVSFLKNAKGTIPSIAFRSGLEGTAYGAIYGFGTGETMEERLKGALREGAEGGLAGTVFGIPLGTIARLRGGSGATLPSFRNTESAWLPKDNPLRQSASELYDSMRAAGVAFNQQSVTNLRNAIFTAALDAVPEARGAVLAGNWDTIPDNIKGMLQAASNIRNNPVAAATGLDEIDLIRQFIGDSVPRSGDNNAAMRIANAMRREIDAFVNAMDHTTLVSGVHPENAAVMLQNGRALWSDLMKAETVNRAFYYAANNPSAGLEGLRAEFRSLARDDAFMRSLSEAERSVFNEVMRGGTNERFFRALQSAFPNQMHSWQNVIPGLAVAGAIHLAGQAPGVSATAGLAGAAALPMAGSLAGSVANASQRASQRAAEFIFRNQGLPYQLPPLMRSMGAGWAAGTATSPYNLQSQPPFVYWTPEQAGGPYIP